MCALIRSQGQSENTRFLVRSTASPHSCELVPHSLKLSVGLTGQVYLLDIEGLYTQGSRPARTVGGSVGEILEWTVLIGRTGFNTRASIQYAILSLSYPSIRTLTQLSARLPVVS
jgi:hypothetical protein